MKLRSPVANPRAVVTAIAATLAPLGAQAPHYTLRIVDVAARLAEVRAEFPTAGQDALELFLPVWSPGYYRRQAYHERIASLTAAAGDTSLPVDHPADNRWRIVTHGAATTVVTYTLHCERGSVTENHFGAGYAVFCGPATFVGEVGRLARPHALTVELPPEFAAVATALPQAADGRFVAADYDALLDAPIALGAIATAGFDVLGAHHEWAQFGDVGPWDPAPLLPTLGRVTAELCSTFGAVPFDRYVFLADFGGFYGGLEHGASTLVSVSRAARADDPGFLSFLAHEYAHAFNGKRLRPAELGPFDYEHPPTTPSLWITEGFTTWFGDLALVRAGAIDSTAWLALVAGHVRTLQRSPGRHRQTLAAASSSVWNDSTSGVGGDPRTTISYYVKGPVVAFLLEARLRTASAGERGLDAVVPEAYRRYGGARGFTPAEFEAVASEAAGTDLGPWFDRTVRSTDELDYAEALQWFGLSLDGRDDAPPEQRWRLRLDDAATPRQTEHLRNLLRATPPPTSAAGDTASAR